MKQRTRAKVTVVALMVATVWVAMEPTAPARLVAGLHSDVSAAGAQVARFLEALR